MTKINYDSTVNQNIKRQFVGQEVITCQSSMVDYILGLYDYDNAPFTWDDVEGLYIDNSEEIEELQEELEVIENRYEITEISYEEYMGKVENIEQKIEELEEEQETPQEIYEWWEVTPFMLARLKEYGEPVIDHMNLWGRGTSGQAILLDYVVSRICEDMEILEGQTHSWEAE